MIWLYRSCPKSTARTKFLTGSGGSLPRKSRRGSRDLALQIVLPSGNQRPLTPEIVGHPLNPANRDTTNCRSFRGPFSIAASPSDVVQSLRQVRNQILDILDSDRNANQRVRQADFLAQLTRDA